MVQRSVGERARQAAGAEGAARHRRVCEGPAAVRVQEHHGDTERHESGPREPACGVSERLQILRRSGLQLF